MACQQRGVMAATKDNAKRWPRHTQTSANGRRVGAQATHVWLMQIATSMRFVLLTAPLLHLSTVCRFVIASRFHCFRHLALTCRVSLRFLQDGLFLMASPLFLLCFCLAARLWDTFKS